MSGLVVEVLSMWTCRKIIIVKGNTSLWSVLCASVFDGFLSCMEYVNHATSIDGDDTWLSENQCSNKTQNTHIAMLK